MKDFLALMNPTRWAVLAGVVLALLTALAGAAAGIHTKGEAAGRAAERLLSLEIGNEQLRERGREIARLVHITHNLNEAYREQIDSLEAAERRAAADAERVRNARAERDAAIARADAPSLRVYAATAADVYGDCREAYRGLGLQAARCSAAAHTLNAYAAEVSGRPSAPTPPTPPSQP